MITVEINESTPANMLRAIRAACNELLGEQPAQAGALNKNEVIRRESMSPSHAAPYAAGSPVEGSQFYRVGEQPSEQTTTTTTTTTIIEPIEDNRQDRVPDANTDEPAEELDSAGHAWNAELHARTKSKNGDGTWKKRRGAAQTDMPAAPAVPPVPPAPTAEPIMPKIFALITSQIVTINQAVEAAQAEGYADLGANGLGGAPVEKQLAVLRKLESA